MQYIVKIPYIVEHQTLTLPRQFFHHSIISVRELI